MGTYQGLTWDHPRGRAALEEAARRAKAAGRDLDLRWDIHPLEGFESSPIHRLAEQYDVIVLDHPHLGEALEHGSLRPLDEIFSPEEVERLATETVGPALQSYVYEGHLWALPLDAATQVGALRADQIQVAPQTWHDVATLADECAVALSLAGPHAFLTFSSVCVALGEEPSTGVGEFVSRTAGLEAFELLTRLADRAPEGTAELNPISMLELMSTSDQIAYCPLIFGYVNYATPNRTRPVTFVDAPTGSAGVPGSTIGGTGLALTVRSEPGPELLEHLRWLLAVETQTGFIPEHEGQPSAIAAWEDDRVNLASGDFYRNTRRTIEHSWVRPRYRGFIAFQTRASAVIRSVLHRETTPQAGLDQLQNLFSASVASS